MRFPFFVELTFEAVESKKSIIFTISVYRKQSALAEKGFADLNSHASNVFAEKSF